MKVTDEQWEQRRYEIAKELAIKIYDLDNHSWGFADYAEHAVDFADALIKELKETKP
jgi:hypothetical protein